MMNEEDQQPQANPAEPAPEPGVYRDDDLVYVDPETRTVVGRVEWSNAGRPKSMAMKKPEAPESPVASAEQEEKGPPAKGGRGGGRQREKRGPQRVRYYPWGTYRSMKRVYKIEGKIPKEESSKTLDEVIVKALNEPFWD